MALKLQAEVGVDGSGFESGIKRLEGMAEHFTDTIKGFAIGAIGIATMEQAISRTVETAKELVETSERLSIAPEQLQVLRQAAKQSGIEVEALAGAFEKVNIARAKALQPGIEGHELRVRFGQAGINEQQLRSSTAAQLFMGPLAQLARGGSAEQVGPILREILGKGFGELMPVLKTDFVELEKEMRRFGGIMDTETAVKLAAFSKELSLVSQIVTSQLGPALVKLAEIAYVAMLKIAGGIAGMAAFAGGATSKFNARDIGLGALALGTGNFTELARILKRDVNIDAGKNAAIQAIVPFQAKIGDFQEALKRLAEDAKNLQNPPGANFTEPQDKLSRRALERPSDSLTKVGNFLGGFGPADRWQQQKINLLTQIAKNTQAGPGRYQVDPYGLNNLFHHNNFGVPGAPG